MLQAGNVFDLNSRVCVPSTARANAARDRGILVISGHRVLWQSQFGVTQRVFQCDSPPIAAAICSFASSSDASQPTPRSQASAQPHRADEVKAHLGVAILLTTHHLRVCLADGNSHDILLPFPARRIAALPLGLVLQSRECDCPTKFFVLVHPLQDIEPVDIFPSENTAIEGPLDLLAAHGSLICVFNRDNGMLSLCCIARERRSDLYMPSCSPQDLGTQIRRRPFSLDGISSSNISSNLRSESPSPRMMMAPFLGTDAASMDIHTKRRSPSLMKSVAAGRESPSLFDSLETANTLMHQHQHQRMFGRRADQKLAISAHMRASPSLRSISPSPLSKRSSPSGLSDILLAQQTWIEGSVDQEQTSVIMRHMCVLNDVDSAESAHSEVGIQESPFQVSFSGHLDSIMNCIHLHVIHKASSRYFCFEVKTNLGADHPSRLQPAFAIAKLKSQLSNDVSALPTHIQAVAHLRYSVGGVSTENTSLAVSLLQVLDSREEASGSKLIMTIGSTPIGSIPFDCNALGDEDEDVLLAQDASLLRLPMTDAKIQTLNEDCTFLCSGLCEVSIKRSS